VLTHMSAFLEALAHRLAAAARVARRAAQGSAAVEFALIMPVALLLYVGIVDVTRGVIASRKLDLLSRTVADLVSQQSTTTPVPTSTISTILTAASSIMSPLSTNSLTLTVSAVDIKATSSNTCCQALVRWSYTQGGTLRAHSSSSSSSTSNACNVPLTQVPNGTAPAATNIPASLITANQNAGFGYTSGGTSYLIIADVSYTYSSIFSQAATWFTGGMKKTTYMVPRDATGPVTLTNPINPPTGQSGITCF
jgi:Flp pilus assembly protein TadG